jgi:hypothetical protein
VRRAILEVVLAVAAAIGCVASWLLAQSPVAVAPVSDGEPATTSVAYDPLWLFIALVLGTLAGVLLVVGAARWRRSRTALKPT